MEKMTISAFGDSIMKGTVLDSTSPLHYSIPSKTFTDMVSESLDIDINNYSRFGSTVAVGERMLCRHEAGLGRSAFTLLEFGGNDCDYNWLEIAKNPDGSHLPFTPLTELTLGFERMVRMIREAGSTPVILSLPPLVPDRFFKHITRDLDATGRLNVLNWIIGEPEYTEVWHSMYNFHIVDIAKRLGVKVIDISTPFTSDPDYGRFYCADGIHPNEQGQALIAEVVSRELSALIGGRCSEGMIPALA